MNFGNQITQEEVRSLTLTNAPGNAARKQARKHFCLRLGALDRDTWGKNTTKEHQPNLNHRLHHLQSQLLPFLQLRSSPQQDEDVTVPCAAASWEMASIAGASGLQHRQMKVGRRRGQPLFEEAVLKPRRQEDAGTVVRNLLPRPSPHQEPPSPARPEAGAAPGPATSTLQPSPGKAELCPIRPGREIINREETANVSPALPCSGRKAAGTGQCPVPAQPSQGCSSRYPSHPQEKPAQSSPPPRATQTRPPGSGMLPSAFPGGMTT